MSRTASSCMSAPGSYSGCADEVGRSARGDQDPIVRRLIVSDIHGNWEALQGVLRHCEGAYDEVVCCGDLVGYNAAPAEVIEWARRSARMVVRGNHDRACCDGEGLEFFNPQARAAAMWTRDELGEDDRLWLQELPEGPLVWTSMS